MPSDSWPELADTATAQLLTWLQRCVITMTTPKRVLLSARPVSSRA